MVEETPNFRGLHVAAFESRRADEMRRLIEKYGGAAHVSPSMREVLLEDQRPESSDNDRLFCLEDCVLPDVRPQQADYRIAIE
jgi:hypothetical protein